ncbi:MAG: signal peptidase I [Candidatus Freyarchaeota archaeon]
MKQLKLRYVAVLAVLAAVFFMNYVMPMIPALRSIGARVMVVASGSMRPFLNLGDIVMLRGIDPEEIEVGDVIAFNVAPRFQQQYGYPPTVMHRVINISRVGSDLYFQTKGDASEKDPFTVPAIDVIGLYDWKIPYAGLPFLFLRSVYGMALLASYMAIEFVFDYGPRWWSSRKERERTLTMILEEAADTKRAVESLSSSFADYASKMEGPKETMLLRRDERGRVTSIRRSELSEFKLSRRADEPRM